MNIKVKSFKQTVFLSERCAMSKVTTSVQRAVFRPCHFGCVKSPLFLVKNCPSGKILRVDMKSWT